MPVTAFPGLRVPVALWHRLAAYSCGGSCGIGTWVPHRIPSSLSCERPSIRWALNGDNSRFVNRCAAPAAQTRVAASPEVGSTCGHRYPGEIAMFQKPSVAELREAAHALGLHPSEDYLLAVDEIVVPLAQAY